ncbi:hypothetical protein R3I94_015987 [Phoxinus phoxinus]
MPAPWKWVPNGILNDSGDFHGCHRTRGEEITHGLLKDKVLGVMVAVITPIWEMIPCRKPGCWNKQPPTVVS